MPRKHVCIITGTYNEAGNIVEFYERVTAAMALVPEYTYDIRCIDNCSTDSTRDEIRQICARDERFKAIFNVRNFGAVRSGMHNFYQARGDAVILMASDLEDSPELLPEFLRKWEQGYKLVLAVRTGTQKRGIMPFVRHCYYSLLQRVSSVQQIPGATGFGLYDKVVMDALREINDPYPYLRGLICELGWPIAQVPFMQCCRPRGISSYNFMGYFDNALLGIVNHSKLPLRVATLTGCAVSFISFSAGIYYLAQKLLYWDSYQAGLAPALVGIFFCMGLLFLFLGLIGEYVGLLVTHVVRRPMAVESESINFKEGDRERRA